MAKLGDWIDPHPHGIYVKPADVWIDPSRPSPVALVTHGHADHARGGHEAGWATPETLAIMDARYGPQPGNPVAYGHSHQFGDVKATFVPAGHVLGSAQILLEYRGERIVVSGDYKRRADPTCARFEPVKCDVFITEATFGLPVFRHGSPEREIEKLLRSVSVFPERAHLVGAYSLGKAQRVIALIRAAGYDKPIYLHGALEKITAYYAKRIGLGELRLVSGAKKAELSGVIAIAPPSSLTDLWSRRFPDPVTAFASGWMRVRARARQRGIELPLVISDHADWDGLTATIAATGAREVWVTHGAEEALVHWCTMRQLRARPLQMVGYGDEEEDDHAPDEASGAASA